MAEASVALVGDASYSAFTGPIQGSRYRFEVTPTAGTLNFTTLLADYRKYLFVRPITFAFRGLHYGRYGKSADDSTTLYPLFLGEESLMRGYSVRLVQSGGVRHDLRNHARAPRSTDCSAASSPSPASRFAFRCSACRSTGCSTFPSSR